MKYVLILLLVLHTHLFSIDNQWMVYDRSNSEIPCIHFRSIEIDNKNNLWLGSVQEFTKPSAFGLVKYDGISWELFKKGTSAKQINSMVFKNDTLWIAADDGLFLFHNNQILSFSDINQNFPKATFLKILLDSNNNIWVSSYFGLYKISNNNFELFETSNSPIPENYIRAMTVDNKNICNYSAGTN